MTETLDVTMAEAPPGTRDASRNQDGPPPYHLFDVKGENFCYDTWRNRP